LTGLLLIPVVAFTSGSLVELARQRWLMALAGGGLAMTSYGIALWAMTHAPIGAVAALRETSVLFGAVIAAVVLKERFGPPRWIATVAIGIGLVLLRVG
jgi:drug/metabolite transporter (DMT)-like permease